MTGQQQNYSYATHLNYRFAPLELVDVPGRLVAACKDEWYNQTLCKVNDSVVRLGVMKGEHHWHGRRVLLRAGRKVLRRPGGPCY